MSDREVCASAIAAVRRVLGDAGSMTTKIVIIAETVELEGQRAVWTATDEDAAAWDTTGLLTFALQREQAAMVHTILEERDE